MSKTDPDHSQTDPVHTDTDPDLLVGQTNIGPDLYPTDNSPGPGQADTGPDLGQDLGYKGKTRKVLHDIQCLKKVSLFG
jgi:hypothetical protein